VLSTTELRYASAALLLFLLIGLVVLTRLRRGGPPSGEKAAVDEPLWAEGLWFLLNGLPPSFILVGVVAPGLVYGTDLNLGAPAGAAIQALGLVLWLGGAGLGAWAGVHLGKYMRPRMAVAEGQPLVTTGPFALMRHPTYTGAMAMAVGAAFLLLHAVLIANALAVVGMAYRRTLKEERLLGDPEAFGEAYREYAKRTGRFLPRTGRR
jgi:protein-S-isoprenylcysteine O-methyltransferase Ste14